MTNYPQFVYDDEWERFFNDHAEAASLFFPQDVLCPHCYFSELVWFRDDVKEAAVQCTTCGRINAQKTIRIEDAPDA
jgi:hypothetical protein